MLILGGAALFATAPAHAADETNEQKAERLFKSGEKKFDAGHAADACPDFEASLKVVPKLGTLLNVALCHETTNKLATAWSEFHHAAAWATQTKERERRDFAVTHILSLEARLPRVGLRLPPLTTISTIELDGEPLPEQRWYLPLYVDAGEHAIAVSAPGKQRTTIRFRATESTQEQIVFVPSLSDEKPAPPPEAKSGGPPTLVLVGIGIGVFVAGAALGYGLAKL